MENSLSVLLWIRSKIILFIHDVFYNMVLCSHTPIYVYYSSVLIAIISLYSSPVIILQLLSCSGRVVENSFYVLLWIRSKIIPFIHDVYYNTVADKTIDVTNY